MVVVVCLCGASGEILRHIFDVGLYRAKVERMDKCGATPAV